MGKQKIWLLKLVFPIRCGGLLSACAIFCVLYLILNLGAHHRTESNAPLLFYSAIIAYIVWAFDFITSKTQTALHELRPQLALSDSEYAEAMQVLGYCKPWETLVCLGVGVAGGTTHIAIIMMGYFSGGVSGSAEGMGILGSAGTMLVWIVVSAMTYFLVSYARLFALLGKDAIEINLFNTRTLVPFSRVAINASLAIIGAMALFPLMYFNQTSVANALPGLVSMSVPMIVIFAIPIWPVHARLRDARDQTLDAVDAQLNECCGSAPARTPDTDSLERLIPLLQYRREILQAPLWPFDASAYTRMGLYLVIVPLTWAGAAMIEMLMEAYL